MATILHYKCLLLTGSSEDKPLLPLGLQLTPNDRVQDLTTNSVSAVKNRTSLPRVLESEETDIEGLW